MLKPLATRRTNIRSTAVRQSRAASASSMYRPSYRFPSCVDFSCPRQVAQQRWYRPGTPTRRRLPWTAAPRWPRPRRRRAPGRRSGTAHPPRSSRRRELRPVRSGMLIRTARPGRCDFGRPAAPHRPAGGRHLRRGRAVRLRAEGPCPALQLAHSAFQLLAQPVRGAAATAADGGPVPCLRTDCLLADFGTGTGTDAGRGTGVDSDSRAGCRSRHGHTAGSRSRQVCAAFLGRGHDHADGHRREYVHLSRGRHRALGPPTGFRSRPAAPASPPGATGQAGATGRARATGRAPTARAIGQLGPGPGAGGRENWLSV